MKYYTHKKGSHTIGLMPIWIPKIWLMRKPKRLAYKVEFDDSCEYYHPNGYGGINKLFGVDFSLTTSGNFGWSYMFGWAWETDQIVFYAYINKPDSSHIAIKIGSSKVGQKNVNLEMLFNEKSVTFIFNKGDVFEKTIDFKEGFQSNFSREIRPWFGGTYPAPNDIKIGFEQLNK